jgi:purine-nucleoside phosphorylase
MADNAKTLVERLDEASNYIKDTLSLAGTSAPEIGIVLGSGLGPLAEQIANPVFIDFADVPYMKTSTALSHVGRFVVGKLSGKQVICMQGRLHGYEGYSSQEVAFPIWLMQKCGAGVLITTNAAGAINEGYNVGDFCIMRDHINFTGRNPIAGQDPNELAPRFFGMLDAYDSKLRALARRVAIERGISVQEGVYLGLLGPSFETPAEINAFRRWGADTVAMSVCEEVIAANHVGMRVCGISLISNMAAGVGGGDPFDDDIYGVAAAAEANFCSLIEGLVEAI